MEDAAARKERLKALRQAAAAAGELGTSGNDAAQAEEPEKPVLKFRNYAVQDTKRIDYEKVAPAQPPKFEEPVADIRPEELPQEELLVNIAPKKANWDLKRDVQAKLDKLERRTMRTIMEMMQEEERKRMEEGGPAAEEED